MAEQAYEDRSLWAPYNGIVTLGSAIKAHRAIGEAPIGRIGMSAIMKPEHSFMSDYLDLFDTKVGFHNNSPKEFVMGERGTLKRDMYIYDQIIDFSLIPERVLGLGLTYFLLEVRNPNSEVTVNFYDNKNGKGFGIGLFEFGPDESKLFDRTKERLEEMFGLEFR